MITRGVPRRVLVVVLLLTATAGVTVTTATAKRAFPPSIYPPPVHAQPGPAFSACPKPSGLEPFNAASTKLAQQLAARYGHVSLAADLARSDRSFWPQLRRFWRQTKHGAWLSSLQAVRTTQLGGPSMVWSGVVRYYCGPKLVAESLNVVITVRHLQRCADCNGGNEFFIDRRGTPLVYMVH